MTASNEPPQQMHEKSFMMEYLEEKFKSVHKRMDDIDKDNEGIGLSVQHLSQSVESMQISESRHFQNCPNTAEILILKDKLSEFLFFKKYWKVFALSAAITIFAMLFSAMKTWQEYQILSIKNNLQKSERPITNKNTPRNIQSIDSVFFAPGRK